VLGGFEESRSYADRSRRGPGANVRIHIRVAPLECHRSSQTPFKPLLLMLLPNPAQPAERPRPILVNPAQLWRRRESNGGPAIMPEDVGAIRSAHSGEESGTSAEARESGSAPGDTAGSGACSSVARGPALAGLRVAIQTALVPLEAGESAAAAAQMRELAATLAPELMPGIVRLAAQLRPGLGR